MQPACRLALRLVGVVVLGAGLVLWLGSGHGVDLPGDGRLEVPLLPRQALRIWVRLVPEMGYSTVDSTVYHASWALERALWIGVWYHNAGWSTRLGALRLPIWAVGGGASGALGLVVGRRHRE